VTVRIDDAAAHVEGVLAVELQGVMRGEGQHVVVL
jgi:hypothetical protein